MTAKRYLTGYKKFMTDDEILMLIDYANTQTDLIRLAFYILIFMGLRVGEVVRLQYSNIHGNKLVFPLEKSNRIHERVIPQIVLFELKNHLRKYDINEGYIFSTKYSFRYNGQHDHIQTSTIGCHIKKFREKEHINDCYYTRKNGNKLYRVSVHTIRHWFLVKSYEKSNKDVLLVADIIGHKKLETTFSYLRAWRRMQREESLVNSIAEI